VPEVAAAVRAVVSVTTLVLVLIEDIVYCEEPIVTLPPASIFAIEFTVTVVAPEAAAAVKVVGENTPPSLIPHA